MVVKIEMTAEDVSDEVRRLSIGVGFLLVAIFVLPCVAFALLSKYCQKQRRKRRPTVASLLELQHRSSIFMRNAPIPEEEPTTYSKDSCSESTTNGICSYGPLGQVECSLDHFKDLEKTIMLGACLSCLNMWKVRIPSTMGKNKELIGKLVLVKKISAVDAKSHIPCMKADIATLSRIPPHPLVLSLIGVCNSGGVPQAVMLEYPLHGRFHSFLVLKRKCLLSGNTQHWNSWTQRDSERGIAEATRMDLSSLSPLLSDSETRCHPYSQPLNSAFTETDLLLFALQTASALDHLTQRNVLHKGLSSENLMIGADFYLKVTGMFVDNGNRHKEPAMRQLKRTTSGRNLFKWDAPEVMGMAQHTEKTEVWRFGMTMWEVCSMGETPYADTPNRTLSDTIKTGQRPRAPENCSRQLYKLMMDCWELNPNLRPTFGTIVERIQNMISSVVEEEANHQPVNRTDGSETKLHRRQKRQFFHSHKCPDLVEGGFTDVNTSSLSSSPATGPSPPVVWTPLNMRCSKISQNLEEIPESSTETDV